MSWRRKFKRKEEEPGPQPDVMLDFKRDWCPEHLEPFRDDWPAGAGVAMLALFEELVNKPEFIDAMPKNAGGKADATKLDAVKAEFRPLCCFVGDEAMARVYEKAGKEAPND